jgi:hypothetical protein
MPGIYAVSALSACNIMWFELQTLSLQVHPCL